MRNNRNSRKQLRAAGRLSLLAAVCALVLLAGCAGREMPAESGDTLTPVGDDLIVVGVSQVGSESVWRTANTASLQRVFTKENGYFLIFENARQKQENQIKALRSFISQRVDYIVFSPLTEEGWETVLTEAKEAQIPVIMIDRKVKLQDESLYTTWIGSDFKLEGRMAGEALEQALKRSKKDDKTVRIVVLTGTEGATATIGRTEGFEEVASLHDNWVILEEVDAEFTTAKGQEEMERLIRTYHGIDVVIAQNDDMAFGALDALEQAGISVGEDGDVLMVSFDGTRNALKLVDEGVIAADIECNPNQGEMAERVIRRLEQGMPVAKLYFVPEMAFTQENAGNAAIDRDY